MHVEVQKFDYRTYDTSTECQIIVHNILYFLHNNLLTSSRCKSSSKVMEAVLDVVLIIMLLSGEFLNTHSIPKNLILELDEHQKLYCWVKKISNNLVILKDLCFFHFS